MRTTIEIDAELLEKAKERAAQEGRSVDEFVEDTLRVALKNGTAESRKAHSFLTVPGAPFPGVNLDKTSELLDDDVIAPP